MSDCQFCGKILSKEKGEEDHGCLDCHGYIYIVNDVEVCFHCIEIENRELRNEVSSLMSEMARKMDKMDTLTTKLVSYEATLGFLKDTLREIADEDYRGNRSNASVKAYQVLKKIGAYKEEK